MRVSPLDNTNKIGYIYYRSERSGRRNPSNALAAADSRPGSLLAILLRIHGTSSETTMSTNTWRALSNVCFVAGFLSVTASIAIWFLAKEPDLAHGERFGIFVGLWAPTFFALSSRLQRFATPTLQ